MMSMGMTGNPAVSSAAFWQQARQLPHMNTFNMNNTMTGSPAMVSGASAAAGMGHMGHPHGTPHVNPAAPPHDAKMAEKIVSELQVTYSKTIYQIDTQAHIDYQLGIYW